MEKCKHIGCNKPGTCKCRKVKQSNAPVIWILGGPGCGKGTQCDKIVKKYNFKHFSTGDLLRAEVASGSDKGKELKEIMSKGALVSNDDVLQILERAMVKVSDSANGFLIDGYPREKDQGTAFEKYVAPVDLIIFFDCSDETMTARILHRAKESTEVRADDNEEAIKIRLATFRKNTNEIMAQYQQKTVVINAERGVDEIFADVQAAIDNAVANKKQAAAAALS
ncbi:adenylate kinase isoenzyme 1 isoform X2 [Hermetia illucens]|uniref:adenylate kinase isoenzyme 1 isoform X2 n=1 Tax=Hermetia illucens TaxID=343691 RepID=UPI0018CC445C|nr:adenylate kinase isoenzyme 1 isoform X2 [Hermetia illucens]